MSSYFFHSFPRRRKGEDRQKQVAKGLLILRSLLDNGLLLTPETYELPLTDATGAVVDRLRATQRRACFTELEPEALPAHAATFGPFALVYEIPRLRQLGALPVFYVPLQTEGGYLSPLATELLGGLVDAKRLVDYLAAIQKNLTVEPSLKLWYHRPPQPRSVQFDETSTRAIKSFLEELMTVVLIDAGATASKLTTLASTFYPTENPIFTQPLHYYRQREWRIVSGPLTYQGKEHSVQATADQIAQLLAIDAEFFSKELLFYNPAAGIGALESDTIARRSHFFRSLGDLDVVGSAYALVAPDDCDLSANLVADLKVRGISVHRESSFSTRDYDSTS